MSDNHNRGFAVQRYESLRREIDGMMRRLASDESDPGNAERAASFVKNVLYQDRGNTREHAAVVRAISLHADAIAASAMSILKAELAIALEEAKAECVEILNERVTFEGGAA